MNHNIRKRRASCLEDAPAEPASQGFTHSSSPVPGNPSWFADPRYILEHASMIQVTLTTPLSTLLDPSRPDSHQFLLEQAALNTNIPYSILVDLSNREPHAFKRPRLDTYHQMPNSYTGGLSPQGDHEKSPLAGQPGFGVDPNRKPHEFLAERCFSSGWTAPRIADCLASFPLCGPYSSFEPQPAYQPLPSTSSYGHYDGALPHPDTAVVTVQPQAQVSLVPTPITPNLTPIFPCDDPSMFSQYLPDYPPLQPTRALELRPASGKEEMVYPRTSAIIDYDNLEDNPQGSSSLERPPQICLLDSPLQPTTLAGTYGIAGRENSTYDSHSGLVGLDSRLHQMQSPDNKPEVDDSGVNEGTPQKPVPVKRGPFRDQDQREKTAITRKMGSCIRCRMQRIRCNLDPENIGGPCLSCKKIATNTRVYRLNCLRLKITDVRLFKPGQVKGQEWTSRWKDSVMEEIGSWESPQTRTIQVTEGYTGKSVKLQVRQFRPQPGDSLERTWVSNGVKKRVTIPPYAIVNLDDARAAFDEYIKTGLLDCCKHLLGSRDSLLSRVYALAIKVANDPSTLESESNLLKATLDLWMSVRLTTKSFEIVGDDTLDMPRDIINDHDNPLYGKIPLPPVMGAQIDSVLIHQIQPRLRRKTLEELQKMTQEKKQKTWLTTFLVTFILLHNIALITKHDADYARKHGLKRRFAREANVREYNLGANTLLAYFHYCNKAVYPFSTECKDQDLQSLAELDAEAISFVHYARRFVAEHKKQWESLWAGEDYEHEYYYVSQLFEQNWQPRTMV
ncbi:hypothetical protein VTK26DRAFT_4863 [Humicola hyalothermophila]